jgi:hypothetical protein
MTNRKPFDLEKALAGEPVVTGDGRKVLELKLFKSQIDNPLVCLIEGREGLVSVRSNGLAMCDHDYDLFMAPKKKKLWIAVSKEPYQSNAHFGSAAYKEKDELIEHIKRFGRVPENFHLMQIEIDE